LRRGARRLTNDLTHKYEKEKTKLNELGEESLAKGIPLSVNETVLTQSRKVDELVTRFYVQKTVEREQGNR
jgi:hypothetical protein